MSRGVYNSSVIMWGAPLPCGFSMVLLKGACPSAVYPIEMMRVRIELRQSKPVWVASSRLLAALPAFACIR